LLVGRMLDELIIVAGIGQERPSRHWLSTGGEEYACATESGAFR
jgi:hypothetical protein